MMTNDLHVNIWDLVFPLARVVDMMSPVLAQHHMRVAYLAARVAEELGVPPEERRDILVAGALHDIGAFSLNERLDLLDFEEKHAAQHSLAGYLLLRDFPPFENAASIVHYHHVPWKNGAGRDSGGVPVPRGSLILYLADRVAVLLDQGRPVLPQVERIRKSIQASNGSRFAPDCVDAFFNIASREHIWLEVASGDIPLLLTRGLCSEPLQIDTQGLLKFAHLICRIIDFKSRFTASHSTGVAATATALGRWIGFSQQECKMLQIAAFFHDLGKLAVPSELIEKPGSLSAEELQVMRSHVYHTYSVLEPIDALSVITSWSALHQERLNGTGHPFHYSADELPLGARIMAVADVFTALTEDRPYRSGMDKAAALATLEAMAADYELDPAIVAIVEKYFDEANGIRAAAQRGAIREYDAFRAALS